MRCDKDEGQAPTRKGEEKEGNLQVEGEAVEKEDYGNPVEVIGKKKRKDAVSIKGPVPSTEDLGGGPAQFEPKEVTDGHGQTDPWNKNQAVEGHFGQEDRQGMAEAEEVSLENIEKINEEAVKAKEKKVPAKLAKTLGGPDSVRPNDCADGLGQDRPREGGE